MQMTSVIMDTLIIQTAAKSHTKTNHRFLTEMNYVPLLWTLANDHTNSYSVRCEGSSL